VYILISPRLVILLLYLIALSAYIKFYDTRNGLRNSWRRESEGSSGRWVGNGGGEVEGEGDNLLTNGKIHLEHFPPHGSNSSFLFPKLWLRDDRFESQIIVGGI
jgi:hypothetical protein